MDLIKIDSGHKVTGNAKCSKSRLLFSYVCQSLEHTCSIKNPVYITSIDTITKLSMMKETMTLQRFSFRDGELD